MQRAFAEYVGVLPVDSGATSETLEDVLAVMRQGGAVLAFLGGEAVGCARFKRDGQDLYVARVSVLPAYRRRGVASSMMRFLELQAASLGHAAIRIGVRNSLPSNIGLYQSLGYELVSIDPHPRGADQVWTMRKWLSAR
jgi:ribosomal protein S18 acetylase RimI-like enzyme